MQLKRLSDLANFLASRKTLDEAVRYIALNACLTSYPCRLYIAKLDKDLTLHHYASFGFSDEFLEKNQNFLLRENPGFSEAIMLDRISIKKRDTEYFGNIRQVISDTSENDHWKTTVFIPLLPHFAATLTLQSSIETNEETINYFELLRSLIHLYLQLTEVDHGNQKKQNHQREVTVGMALTERQQQILSLVKSGMTNPAIAAQMGYSESLIRQETMVIYQKLGVDGRRELVSED